ncbi:MAG: hypothetical protein WCF67_21760, partial [Chitinophagaceae bacterium]
MKYFLMLITCWSLTAAAQTPLEFNKRFVECEDKWVAFQAEEDGTHAFGFIYIDEHAGLTLNH